MSILEVQEIRQRIIPAHPPTPHPFLPPSSSSSSSIGRGAHPIKGSPTMLMVVRVLLLLLLLLLVVQREGLVVV
jgi:hypothetical protein